MNSLDASIRDNKTKGQLNAIRHDGSVPAIVYGGKDENQKISISKKLLKVLIEKENFLSNIITLNVDGKPQNVLPREVKYHIIITKIIKYQWILKLMEIWKEIWPVHCGRISHGSHQGWHARDWSKSQGGWKIFCFSKVLIFV